MTSATTKPWDVFVSHASEDKDTFARPLASALTNLGIRVWYDEFSLRVGDSISRSIDKGLVGSRFGLVIVSHAFLTKPWPEYELRGLVAREIAEDRIILPVWHGVVHSEVLEFSPPLADKVALDTRNLTAQDIAIRLLREIRPDLYALHPRAELERLANGTALVELQDEIERTREELAEYRCPVCDAEMVSRTEAPIDHEQKHWDVRESFACGYQRFDGTVERLCPKDPAFPDFGEFELLFFETSTEPHQRWQCDAIGQTAAARRVELSSGYGATREEAAESVRNAYHRYRR